MKRLAFTLAGFALLAVLQANAQPSREPQEIGYNDQSPESASDQPEIDYEQEENADNNGYDNKKAVSAGLISDYFNGIWDPSHVFSSYSPLPNNYYRDYNSLNDKPQNNPLFDPYLANYQHLWKYFHEPLYEPYIEENNHLGRSTQQPIFNWNEQPASQNQADSRSYSLNIVYSLNINNRN